MKTPEIHRLQVKGSRPPVVEIDSGAQAVYVRFKQARVARTIDRGSASIHIAIDLDSNNEVIGIEMIGMSQFNIEFVVKKARVTVSAQALAKVRYIPALLSARGRSEELLGSAA